MLCAGLREQLLEALKGDSNRVMMPHLSPRASKWGPTLVINVVALSLGSYLALVYHSVATRRLLAEYISSSCIAQHHIWHFCGHLYFA